MAINLPTIMMITWSPLNTNWLSMYKQYGIDTIYRIIGSGDWSVIENTQNSYDFTFLQSDINKAKSVNLNVIPTINITEKIPMWFITKYPDSIIVYGNGTTGQYTFLNLAWLIYSYQNRTEGYVILENFINAFVNELKKYDNVIGIELPWELFGGLYYTPYGDWDGITNYPERIYLGGFDTYSLNRWNPSPYVPILKTWLDYKNSSSTIQNYWQDWLEQITGEAANILLNIIHNIYPELNIIIRKHYWHDGDIAIATQLSLRQFTTFMNFMNSINFKNIIIDNDAFFNYGLITNISTTKQMIKDIGLIFMGEDANAPEWMQGSLDGVKIAKPDVFSFIPYPGQDGSQIKLDIAQEIMSIVRGCPILSCTFQI